MLGMTAGKKVSSMRALVRCKKVAIDLLQVSIDNKDHVAAVRALDKQIDSVIDLVGEAPEKEKSNRGRKPGRPATKKGKK